MGIAPGIYFIVNIDGDELAIQYAGKKTRIFVAKNQNVPSQKWIVSGEHCGNTKPQSIVPVPAQNLQTKPVANFVEPDETAYQWYINESDGVYTVQDNNQLMLWCLDDVTAGKHVVLRKTEDAKHQSWAFIKT